jgi:hypothetical protein
MSVKTGQNNADMLDELNQINNMLAATGTVKPPEWDTWPKEKKLDHIRQVQMGLTQTRDLANTLDKANQNEQQIIEEMSNQGIGPVAAPVAASRKVFNLKRMAQQSPVMPPAPAPAPDMPAAQPQGDFGSIEGLKNTLEQIAASSENPTQDATTLLVNNFVNDKQMITDSAQRPSDPMQLIKDAVQSFYAPGADDVAKTQAASLLYENILPDSVKQDQGPDSNEVPAQLETNVTPHVANLILETNRIIKRLAEENAKTEKQARKSIFNLKKHAQQKTVEEVILHGPDEKAVDQFTGELISDWHLVERNKGFGLRLPGVYNIDFERVWRENVMDKYTPTYIEDRFEVDRNVPEANNMQLKPGQLRKPVLPEYGNTESRLEAERTQMNKDRGYKPAEKGKPFNWKKASADKKKVTAEGGLKPLPPIGAPGEKQLNTEPSYYCSSCGDQLKVGGKQQCKKCGMNMVPNIAPPKTAPDQKGQQMVSPAPVIPMGAPVMASVKSEMRLANRNAIFFDADSQSFIVYAGSTQKKFSLFDEAEKYAQSIPPRPMPKMVSPSPVTPPALPAMPPATTAPANPTAVTPVKPEQAPPAGRIPSNRKVNVPADIEDGVGNNPDHHQSANSLAIDG